MKIEDLSHLILSGLPPYGEMYTSFPEGFYSEGLVVQFNREDNTNWVANFEIGNDDNCLNFIKDLNSKDEILVVVNEMVYIFNKNSKIPLLKFYGCFEKHFTYKNLNILVSSDVISIIENSENIIFLDEFNYHFISDVTFDGGVVSIVTFNYNLPENEWMVIHNITLDDLVFKDFRGSNYYLSNLNKSTN